MLYIVRKLGESILINNEIKVTVLETKGKSAKLGIESPEDVVVLREELFERIQTENRLAHESASFILGE